MSTTTTTTTTATVTTTTSNSLNPVVNPLDVQRNASNPQRIDQPSQNGASDKSVEPVETVQPRGVEGKNEGGKEVKVLGSSSSAEEVPHASENGGGGGANCGTSQDRESTGQPGEKTKHKRRKTGPNKKRRGSTSHHISSDVNNIVAGEGNDGSSLLLERGSRSSIRRKEGGESERDNRRKKKIDEDDRRESEREDESAEEEEEDAKENLEWELRRKNRELEDLQAELELVRELIQRKENKFDIHRYSAGSELDMNEFGEDLSPQLRNIQRKKKADRLHRSRRGEYNQERGADTARKVLVQSRQAEEGGGVEREREMARIWIEGVEEEREKILAAVRKLEQTPAWNDHKNKEARTTVLAAEEREN